MRCVLSVKSVYLFERLFNPVFNAAKVVVAVSFAILMLANFAVSAGSLCATFTGA